MTRILPGLVLCLMCMLLACDEGGGAGALAEGDTGLLDTPASDTSVPDMSSPDTDGQTPDLPEARCEISADCDDGIYCNGVERCAEGLCYPSARPPCVDNIDCTVDRCDEEGQQCVFVADDGLCLPGQVCDLKAGCFTQSECVRDENCDDGVTCNGSETCQDGICQPGVPVACDDGVTCTSDLCDEESGGCQSVPDHTLCLPTELCNLVDDCVPRPSCQRDDDCNDGSFCNGQETCDLDSGQCIPGATPPVDDGVACTIDTCSEEASMVLHIPNHFRCTDGLFCNGAEVCHPVDGCQEGEPPVTSDGVACTTDTCNEELDFIEHAPNDAVCDDGLFCNGAEVCHPVMGCAPGEAPALSDDVGCTIDTCSEVEGRVLHVPSNETCDDGLFCNGQEFCDAERDCQSGTPPALDDQTDCTVDTCDEEADRVVHTPDHAVCDDDLFCNGPERCAPLDEDADERGCLGGAAPVVDDEVGCTTDACDEDNDVVVHTPDDSVCDDTLFCNGREFCDAERDCQAGTAPPISDNLACTADRCDEDSDRIVHVPDHAVCNDGLFCNGREACAPEDGDADDRGCLAGAAPAVDDEVGCTIDTCDEVNDAVVHTPNDAACSDNLFCNGAEFCDRDRDCQPGTPPSLDDDIACTQGRCDEGRDVVVQTPNDSLCSNDLVCDGAESCQVGVGCVDGAPPDDGFVCSNMPRSLCLEQACAPSVCGDDFVDQGAGEQCDDGNTLNNDGCDANCRREEVDGYDGTYNLAPEVSYTCLALGLFTVIDYAFTSFVFSVNNDTLTVAARPRGLPDVVMTQSPAPEDGTFDVTVTIPGTCDETYRLAGSFQEEDQWTGTFSRTLRGNCFECTDGTVDQVQGTRQ